ncbi:MAG: PadR family transcriptional regulator [Chloroflexi bacterium]|nr:PadR family transcriptional regulator [Chloroflexota bacterium]
MKWEDPMYWDMLIRRSLSRFFMLMALAEGPSHGYRLKEAVRTACEGCCQPTDAMIYPAIKELQEKEYIETRTEMQGARERKVCYLTPLGMEAFKAGADAWKAVVPHIQTAVNVAENAKSPEPAPKV